MGKVSYYFLTSLFSICLAYILLINFLGWSGGYRDVIGMSTTADWNQSYFGFSSLQAMLNEFNYTMNNAGGFKINDLLDAGQELLECITFGVPKIISWFKGGAANAYDVYALVRNIFLQPVMITVYTIKLLAILLWWVFVILAIILKAAAGNYNVPFDNPLNWSDVVDSYDNIIRVFGQWCVIAVQSPLTASSCGV